MPDDKHPQWEGDGERPQNPDLAQAPEGEPAGDGQLDPEGQGDAAAQAASQIEGLQDQLLRAAAEMENVRRRSARDVENAHKYALEKFASDLLPVLDSLEKAIEAGSDAGADGVLTEGVALSLKLFLSVLEKAGVVQLDPHGEPFDPQVHEAVAMVPNPNAEPNSVMEVMQKGYTLNGRLVRAAKVVVVSAAGDP